MTIMMMRSIWLSQLGLCCGFDFSWWLSSPELVLMNYMWLDPLGRGYIGSRNVAARLLSW